MTDFSEAYDSITDQVNSFVTTQINSQSTWNALPGGLDKVSTSSIGFAWGISSGTVYYCQLPCEGGKWQVWSPTDKGNVSGTNAVDITTDDTNVYVLFGTGQSLIANSLVSTMANNGDESSSNLGSPKNTLLTSIFSTSSYIWGQDASNNKYRLAKPGITQNWIAVPDPKNIKITSTSGNALYGVDASGAPMKTDQALQSGWSPAELVGSYSKVIGDMDQTALYGIDTTNKLKRCVSGNCNPVLTNNLIPKNVSIDTSKTLWMTTDTPGDVGNVFTKQDSLDISNLMPVIAPLDKQRDSVVDSAKLQFKETTHTTIMQKQVGDVIAFIKKFFNFDHSTKQMTEKQEDLLRQDVTDTHSEMDQLQNALPKFQSVAMYIVAAASVYVFGSFLGGMTHLIALSILSYGIYAVYFTTK
jgi:Asp-tRNA(Asn)/Glu-tRNA(Gln) amidotransferase C subunit